MTIPANDHHRISPKKKALRFKNLDISFGWPRESGILSPSAMVDKLYHVSIYVPIYVCIYKGFRNNTLNRNISNNPSPQVSHSLL